MLRSLLRTLLTTTQRLTCILIPDFIAQLCYECEDPGNLLDQQQVLPHEHVCVQEHRHTWDDDQGTGG